MGKISSNLVKTKSFSSNVTNKINSKHINISKVANLQYSNTQGTSQMTVGQNNIKELGDEYVKLIKSFTKSVTGLAEGMEQVDKLNTLSANFDD